MPLTELSPFETKVDSGGVSLDSQNRFKLSSRQHLVNCLKEQTQGRRPRNMETISREVMKDPVIG